MPADVFRHIRAERGKPVGAARDGSRNRLLRMLENNLENAEDPSRLIVYGGIAKAARELGRAFTRSVDALMNLEDDETLAIQAGMPVAVFRTHRAGAACRHGALQRHPGGLDEVLRPHGPQPDDLLVPIPPVPGNTSEARVWWKGPSRPLPRSLTTDGTAIFAAASSSPRGLGGMGRSQPRAMTMHGGISVVVEVQRGRREANGCRTAGSTSRRPTLPRQSN